MIRKALATVLAVCGFSALSACEAPDQDFSIDDADLDARGVTVTLATMPKVTEYTIDGAQMSPGFLAVADLNRDGIKDVVVTTLMEEVEFGPGGPPTMKGAVHVYQRATRWTPLDQWTETVPFGTDKGFGFINMPQIDDFNGDGKMDIALNTGFLATRFGSQQYLVGPEFTEAVPFTTDTAHSDFFYHQLQRVDLDKDGKKDIVTTRAQFVPPVAGPPRINLAVDWYKADGQGGYTRYTINEAHCGSMIQMYDVDKDKDLDIVCPQFFGPPYAPSIVWFEQLSKPTVTKPTGEWAAARTIDASTGLGMDIRFVDIDNDRKDELVYANHNNQNNPSLAGIPSGIYAFEIPSRDKLKGTDVEPADPWAKRMLDEGYEVTAPDNNNPASQGAPGLIDIADFNGDRRLDIVTSGDGADGLFLLLQNSDKSFTRHELASGNMWGQAVAADIDGDKRPEVVAVQHGYAVNGVLPPGAVKIFRFTKK